MTPIRVLLADDHAVCRLGIRGFLEETDDIVVVAEASDGAVAQHLITTYRPDVAILDIRMPYLNGIEVTRWIRAQGLSLGVLMLSSFDDEALVMASLQAGVNGYLLKDADADDLVAAVRLIHKGQVALAPAITQKLMTRYANTGQQQSFTQAISEREAHVLRLAALGLTNRGIGLRLEISERTVQGHLASIYEKLKVNSRTEAVTRAIQLGLVQLPEAPL